MKALLIGAGRMGLTHMAQINLLTDFGVEWTIVEPSFAVRNGLAFFLPDRMLRKTYGRPEDVRGDFDIAVVCSPTTHHESAWQTFRGRVGRFFIEKPLRVTDPGPEVLCGYVLLHHPLQKRFLARCGTGIQSFSLSLRANTILGPNTGWRGLKASGGGVISEFGSHLLSLLVQVGGPVARLTLDEAKIVHSIDAPDVARLSGQCASGTPFDLTLDWTDGSIRKPTYEVKAVMADGRQVSHDFYELLDGDSRLSIASLESACGVYLRGIEFTEQARFFLAGEGYAEHLAVAVEVDRLLEGLK